GLVVGDQDACGKIAAHVRSTQPRPPAMAQDSPTPSSSIIALLPCACALPACGRATSVPPCKPLILRPFAPQPSALVSGIGQSLYTPGLSMPHSTTRQLRVM